MSRLYLKFFPKACLIGKTFDINGMPNPIKIPIQIELVVRK